MIKLLSAVFGALIFLLVLCFALSNPQSTDIGLWPLDSVIQVPLYIVALVPFLAGLIMGCGAGWVATVPHRLKVRRLNRELSALSSRIADLQKTATFARPSSFMKKKFWKRHL